MSNGERILRGLEEAMNREQRAKLNDRLVRFLEDVLQSREGTTLRAFGPDNAKPIPQNELDQYSRLNPDHVCIDIRVVHQGKVLRTHAVFDNTRLIRDKVLFGKALAEAGYGLYDDIQARIPPRTVLTYRPGVVVPYGSPLDNEVHSNGVSGAEAPAVRPRRKKRVSSKYNTTVASRKKKTPTTRGRRPT